MYYKNHIIFDTTIIRVLHQLLEEKRNEKEVMQTEMEQLTEESKNKEEQSVAQIAALTR